jgi:acyl carrier protein
VFRIPAAEITFNSSQDTIERWDSIGHMHLCVALEDEFHVSFDDRQVVGMTSYESILRILSEASVA